MELELIRQQLEAHYTGRFRTIWVQRSARTNRDLMITLFPVDHSDYTMISLRNLKDLNYEIVFSLIEKELSTITL